MESKAGDLIGLYLKPPQHAAVFSMDEKTAIRTLDRKDPVLPLSPGRAERHGFEYYRHGTLSLYATFDTKTGAVLGKTATRHTSAEFVAFLTDIVANQPKGKEIHVIADNLSAHKTKQVEQFLGEHTNVHMYFTRRTRPGSTNSSCSSPRLSATSSPALSSLPCLISSECLCATSVNTTSSPSP